VSSFGEIPWGLHHQPRTRREVESTAAKYSNDPTI
jgi:hypothetical protein